MLIPSQRSRTLLLAVLGLTLAIAGQSPAVGQSPPLPPQAQAPGTVAPPGIPPAGDGQPSLTGMALAESIIGRPVGVALEAGIGAAVVAPMGQPVVTGTDLAVQITGGLVVGIQQQQPVAAPGLSVFDTPAE